MDKFDANENPIIRRSRRKDDAKVGERKKLLQRIELTFNEYGIVIFKSSRN
jgi:hypothetical protein